MALRTEIGGPVESISNPEVARFGIMKLRRAATPNEAADALAVLYPALLRFAEKQLRLRHLDHQLAEDLVQEAVATWYVTGDVFRSTGQFDTWLRRAMENHTKHMSGRRSDPLDQDPLSLEAQIEEE